jgi:nitrite reductase (NO-forming)
VDPPGLGWWGRNARELKTLFRVVFGIIWLIAGAFKFAPGLVDDFPGMVTDAGAGQPAWLAPWFDFWASQATANPALWVYLTGVFELAVGLSLVFGFMRKIGYLGGAILSMFIWAVPEGFGGPYGSGSTDIGGGVVYAMAFLMLIVINVAYGPSHWSLDYLIEGRWPGWAKIAEFGPSRGRPEPVGS